MRKSRSVLHVESKAFQRELTYKARKRDNELSQRCVQCPKTVDDGYACCKDCRDKMAAGKRAALAHGMCVDCWTEPAVPGKRLCATHASLRQRRQSTTYIHRLVRRRCVRCGKARAQGGLTACKTCAAKDRNYRQTQRQRRTTIKDAEPLNLSYND